MMSTHSLSQNPPLQPNERGREGGKCRCLRRSGEWTRRGRRRPRRPPCFQKTQPVAFERPYRRLPVPNLTPRRYHIIVQREKGLLFFIHTIVIARILLLIAVLDSPLRYRMSLRRLLKVMEHNDVSEGPLKLGSGVEQCEHSAT